MGWRRGFPRPQSCSGRSWTLPVSESSYTRWPASLQIQPRLEPLSALILTSDAEYLQQSGPSPCTPLPFTCHCAHFSDKETEAHPGDMIKSGSIPGLDSLVPSKVFWEQQVNVFTVGTDPWNPRGVKIPAAGLHRAPPTQTTKPRPT